MAHIGYGFQDKKLRERIDAKRVELGLSDNHVVSWMVAWCGTDLKAQHQWFTALQNAEAFFLEKEKCGEELMMKLVDEANSRLRCNSTTFGGIGGAFSLNMYCNTKVMEFLAERALRPSVIWTVHRLYRDDVSLSLVCTKLNGEDVTLTADCKSVTARKLDVILEQAKTLAGQKVGLAMLDGRQLEDGGALQSLLCVETSTAP